MDSLRPPSSPWKLPPVISPPQPPYRNWVELPRDITALILRSLGDVEILNTARLVCSTWRSICNDPSMWRSIDMYNFDDRLWDSEYDKMCRYAVDESCGGLIYINIEHFGTDDLLIYIADGSNHLKRLSFAFCYDISDEGLSEVVAKFPLLEELAISGCPSISYKALEVIAHCCPLLRSLKLNNKKWKHPYKCNQEALAIAENMPDLRRLQILGNMLTDEGLQAILDGCPQLESLDLRHCFNISLDGNLGKRCAEQIKDLRGPYDPTTDDYPFSESPKEDYASRCSYFSWDVHYDDDDDDYDYYYDDGGGGDDDDDYDYL
ncbi:hypothetical protein JCGZ_09259 [Jatropha curcas]|uniref:F-box domain-containing protein n=1 Tax=Jatropha curcas TaxID=180498 RepID=A0A067KFF9_JATCU|nr:putative F-box/LRR-repeat protein 23 [Jatropha curcas]KDP34971.1 hypothetical protein JCGZ_09259 [Jatropha curcas]